MGPKTEKTICETCGKHYESIGFDNWQADDCSSYVENGIVIRCCYGSKHDGDVYLITSDDKLKGVICDSCIDSLLANNKLQLLAEDDLWHEYKYRG